MRICYLLLAAAPLAAALPAHAQDRAVAASYIAQGALSQAESKLLTELRIHPDRPELLLNLAAVYAKTGRAGEARNLYGRVLSQDEVLMDLSADRTAGSHDLARKGLGRLDRVQMTSR